MSEEQLQLRLDWGELDKNYCPVCGNHFYGNGHSKINGGRSGWSCRKFSGVMYYFSNCGSFFLYRKGRDGPWNIIDPIDPIDMEDILVCGI